MEFPKYLLALALLGVACGEARGQKITLTTSCVPLETVVTAISKQCGQKLVVSDDLASEPVVVHLSDVPLETVLQRISEEFVGEWVQTREGLQLERTGASVDAFEKGFAERKRTAVKKSLDDLAVILKSPPMTDNEAHNIAATYVKALVDEKSGSSSAGLAIRFQLANRTPDMRLLAAMTLAIGAEKLSSLPAGRHVFSLEPTPVEDRIDGVDPQVVSQYVGQKNMLANAINAIMPPDTYDGYGDSAMHSATTTAKAPIRPLLEVRNDPSTEGEWVRLMVYDATGNEVIDLGWPIGNQFDAQEYSVKRARARAASKMDADVSLPAEETELAVRAAHMGDIKPLSPGAIGLISHPESEEFLGDIFARILVSQAKFEKRNLIASVSDSDWRIPRLVGKDQVKPSLFELSVQTFKRSIYDRPDGWLLVHPINPLSATRSRLPRSAIGDFARAYFEKGYTTIEEWAELARYVSPIDAPGMIWQYWDLMRGQAGEAYVNDWDALRLYGMLSTDQINELSAGQSLTFYGLPTEIQQALNRMVYDSCGVSPKQGQTADRAHRSARLEGTQGEPFECVITGIPASAQLSATNDKQETIYARVGDDPVERSVDPLEIAAMLVQDEDGPPRGPDDRSRIKTVRVGVKRTITFHLEISDQLETKAELREDEFPSGDPISVADLKDKLPDDVWRTIKEDMEQVRNARAKMGKQPPTSPVQAPPPR